MKEGRSPTEVANLATGAAPQRGALAGGRLQHRDRASAPTCRTPSHAAWLESAAAALVQCVLFSDRARDQQQGPIHGGVGAADQQERRGPQRAAQSVAPSTWPAFPFLREQI